MKYLLFLFVLMASCRQSDGSQRMDQGNYRVRVIEGCEYIEFENSINGANNYSYTLTHKGNCKNPIHCYNAIK